jgi:hypothetical protein
MASERWIDRSIIAGSAMFVFGLTISAIFAPQWRVLHFFQALIYVAVVLLARRRSAWGYGAGVLIAIFWDALILFRSPFGQELVRNPMRPDIVIQLIAALGHVILFAGCLAAFLRKRPTGDEWARFAVGGALAIGYLLVMVFLVGPPEGVQHIKQAFGLT